MNKNNELLKRVGSLGFPLFNVEEEKNINLTLAQVVGSEDQRLWEGFSVMLANAAEKGSFDYERAASYLKRSADRDYLESLLVLSLALYKVFNLKFSWGKDLYVKLAPKKKKEFKVFLERLRKGNELKVRDYIMSSQRLKAVFSNYFLQRQSGLKELLAVKEELGLEYALSQVFSPKQKDLFLKKLKREKLTKTEREYFSRVVKNRVLALANPELQRLAQRLLE